MTTKTEPLTLDDVYVHLMAFEARLLKHHTDVQFTNVSSVNYAGHSGRDNRGCGRHHHGHGRVMSSSRQGDPHGCG